MSCVLTDIPDNRIMTEKGKIIVNPAFDVVLEIQKLYLEDCLTDYEKIEQALYMLVRNRWNIRLFYLILTTPWGTPPRPLWPASPTPFPTWGTLFPDGRRCGAPWA